MRAVYIKSVFFAYLGLFIAAVQQFVTVPLAVDVFGEAGYGLYVAYMALATSTAALLAWLATASAPMLSNALHAGQNEKARDLYQTLRWIHSAFAVGVCLLALLLYFYTPILPPIDTTVFLAALLCSMSLIVTTIEPVALFAAARTDLLNQYRCVSQAIILALFLLVLYIIPSRALLFLSFTAGNIVLYFLCRAGIHRSTLSPFRETVARFHPAYRVILLKFTSLAGSTSALRTLLMLDPLVLTWFLAPASVTIFSYYWLPANFVILGLWKFSENAQPFFMKAFSESRYSAARSIYRRILLVVCVTATFAATAYMLLIAPFQKLWVSYEETDQAIALFFALYIICASVYRLDFAVLYARVRFGDLLLLSSIEMVVKFPLAWFLIPFAGAGCTIAAHAVAHLLILQWYAKYLVHRQFSASGQKE